MGCAPWTRGREVRPTTVLKLKQIPAFGVRTLLEYTIPGMDLGMKGRASQTNENQKGHLRNKAIKAVEAMRGNMSEGAGRYYLTEDAKHAQSCSAKHPVGGHYLDITNKPQTEEKKRVEGEFKEKNCLCKSHKVGVSKYGRELKIVSRETARATGILAKRT